MRLPVRPTLWFIVGFALALLLTPAQSQEDGADEKRHTWRVDTDHSSIQFRASHWGIVDVIGWFETFDVVLRAGGDSFEGAEIEAEVDLASIRMPNPEMADNVRLLVFDTETYPAATFRSTSMISSGEGRYVLTGHLAFREIHHKVELEVQFNGFGIPPLGSPGFTIHGSLKLSDFGMGVAQEALQNEEPTVQDLVHFTCNIRLGYSYE